MEGHGQDLTRGSIRRELWSLAWPTMLSVFFYTLYNIVDAYWVSKLSAEAIAAVSISQLALFIMISLSFGITVGSGVVMAMHIGAKNIKEAERVLGQSFVLSGIAGILFTILSLIFRNHLLTLSGATGAIFAPALEYFTIIAAGSILLFIIFTIIFAYNSQGDNFTPTKLFALSTLINLVLDPIMIFGYAGFPAMGIAGAAYATLISQIVFIIIAIRFLQSPKRKIRFHFYNLTAKWESVKKVLNIGLPASFTQFINPVGAAALVYITSLGFAESGTIAYTLGFRVEFFAYLPAIGFGFGSMALIAQNIGAGNLNRAKESFNKALKYSFFSAAAFGTLAIILARQIIALFTTDPLVTQNAILYIYTVALSYGFLAAGMVEINAFQGIGRSWPGFWLSFLKLFVISIPLSYILTQMFNLPIAAIWGSIIAGNLISSIVGYLWITGALNKFKINQAPVH